ncbi:MAG: PAS domain S-box protein [Deltaproteobacteria bacterium]|nr:PAS domain S-box protein [Deltaproteobacteria bacterium]
MAHKIDDYRHDDSGLDNISAHTDRDSKEALLARIKELEDFYDFSPVGYLSLDPNGQILDLNLGTALMLETERQGLIGGSFYDHIVRDDRDTLYIYLRETFRHKKGAECELRIKNERREVKQVTLKGKFHEDHKDRVFCRSVMLDITERLHAEEKFRLIAETSNDVIFEIDREGIIRYSSPAVENLFGYMPEEVRGTPFEKYVQASDVPKARGVFQEMLSGKKTPPFEICAVSKSGIPVSLEIGTALAHSDGELVAIFGIARDLTWRRQIQETLRRNEEHLRLAVEGGQLGTWDIDLITDEVTWNSILYGLLGRDPGRPITGETFFEYIHPDDLPRVRERVREAFRNLTNYVDEFRVIREDGEVRWLASFGRIFHHEGEQPIRMSGVNFDITDAKLLSIKLHESYKTLEEKVEERTGELKRTNEMLLNEVAKRKRYEADLKAASEKILRESKKRRYLSARLVEIIERDRRDMAMYLHDDLGQMLTSLKMDLELARDGLGRPDGPSKEMLERAEAKALGVMRKVKDISRDLRPNVLDTLGLDRALRSLIENVRMDSGLKVHFHCKDTFKDLDPDKTLAVYRITQEALANMAKYAQATEVFVSLIRKDGSLRLSVEDNGIGFNVDEIMRSETGQGALGIKMMQERALLAGGELTVDSGIGKGTIVSAEIPVE